MMQVGRSRSGPRAQAPVPIADQRSWHLQAGVPQRGGVLDGPRGAGQVLAGEFAMEPAKARADLVLRGHTLLGRAPVSGHPEVVGEPDESGDALCHLAVRHRCVSDIGEDLTRSPAILPRVEIGAGFRAGTRPSGEDDDAPAGLPQMGGR